MCVCFIFALGDYVAIEDNKAIDNKKGRLVREEADDDDGSDDERVDMAGITGAKERDERREKFYSVQYHGKKIFFVNMYIVRTW